MNDFSSMKNNLRIMFTFSDLIIIYTYVLKEIFLLEKGYNSDIKEKDHVIVYV